LDISKLYPPVQFPVSRGTPMIAPLIKWDHKQDYFVYKFDERVASEKSFTVNLQDQDFEYISGHEIDGEFKLIKNYKNLTKLIYYRKNFVPRNWLLIPCMASNGLPTQICSSRL
jgi:hypothetical protein